MAEKTTAKTTAPEETKEKKTTAKTYCCKSHPDFSIFKPRIQFMLGEYIAKTIEEQEAIERTSFFQYGQIEVCKTKKDKDESEE